jgi:uncharacterized protein (TIGR00661 family)
MKVLYAIQGTGNGHLSRAREIIPILQNQVETLDLLVSGAQHQVAYEHEIKYRFNGLTFRASKTGKVSYFGSILKMNLYRFIQEVKSLPVEEYDLIITDFEPVSAWAARLHRVPCVELSHQAGVVMSKPKCKSISDLFIYNLMKFMCPAKNKIGFHFQSIGHQVFAPVIRKEIRALQPETKGHHTVYLPGYSNSYLLSELTKYEARWEVFTKELPNETEMQNVRFHKIDNHAFLESLRTCEGVLCGAGFELPAEALFLGKKVMVIPLKGQFEQYCNAIEAEKLGAEHIPEFSWKYHNTINHWAKSKQKIEVFFPDQTRAIVRDLLKNAQIDKKTVEQIAQPNLIPSPQEI